MVCVYCVLVCVDKTCCSSLENIAKIATINNICMQNILCVMAIASLQSLVAFPRPSITALGEDGLGPAPHFLVAVSPLPMYIQNSNYVRSYL